MQLSTRPSSTFAMNRTNPLVYTPQIRLRSASFSPSTIRAPFASPLLSPHQRRFPIRLSQLDSETNPKPPKPKPEASSPAKSPNLRKFNIPIANAMRKLTAITETAKRTLMAAESKLTKTRTLIQGIKLKEAEEKIREVKAAETSAKELISELTAGSKKILKDLEENAISLNIDLLVFKQKTTILSNMATEMRNNVERGIEKVLNARKDVMLLQLVAKVEVRKRLVLAK